MTSPFDRSPDGTSRSGTQRLIGLDVARAVALIGVVLMNYHGMLNYSGWSRRAISLVGRIFDIHTGALSTRFAATFVVVAGVGVTLLTDSARCSASRTLVLDARLRLVRRGAVLLIAGYFLDMAWPGTILFYYGAFFVFAAFLFDMRTHNLVLVAVVDLVTTIGVSTWRRSRLLEGDKTKWISPSNIESVQDFVVRVFFGYTHPVFPWLSFVIIGMIVGRYMVQIRARVRSITITLVAVVTISYVTVSIVRSFDVDKNALAYVLTSMQPDERGLAYFVSTASIALVAIILIFVVAERARHHVLIVSLQRAGQLSLTLYLGHVLFYYVLAEWSGWGVGTGLGAAVALAVAYWTLAIMSGSWWHRRIGTGPAEWLYRRLGG